MSTEQQAQNSPEKLQAFAETAFKSLDQKIELLIADAVADYVKNYTEQKLGIDEVELDKENFPFHTDNEVKKINAKIESLTKKLNNFNPNFELLSDKNKIVVREISIKISNLRDKLNENTLTIVTNDKTFALPVPEVMPHTINVIKSDKVDGSYVMNKGQVKVYFDFQGDELKGDVGIIYLSKLK